MLTRYPGWVVDDDTWPAELAREFAPHEVPLAEEIVRRYAIGGRSRRLLFANRGEDTGGFGGGISAGELAGVLDALMHCGKAVLTVLEQRSVGNAAGLGALLVSLIELRRDRDGHRSGTQPDAQTSPAQTAVKASEDAVDVPAAAGDVPEEIVRPIDGALHQLADHLVTRGHSQKSAWDLACRLLGFLAARPASAARFIRSLDRSLHDFRAGHDPYAGNGTRIWPWIRIWRWLRRERSR